MSGIRSLEIRLLNHQISNESCDKLELNGAVVFIKNTKSTMLTRMNCSLMDR